MVPSNKFQTSQRRSSSRTSRDQCWSGCTTQKQARVIWNDSDWRMCELTRSWSRARSSTVGFRTLKSTNKRSRWDKSNWAWSFHSSLQQCQASPTTNLQPRRTPRPTSTALLTPPDLVAKAGSWWGRLSKRSLLCREVMQGRWLSRWWAAVSTLCPRVTKRSCPTVLSLMKLDSRLTLSCMLHTPQAAHAHWTS